MKEDLERIILETQLNDHVDSIFAGPSMERIIIVSDGEDEKEEEEAEDEEDVPSCTVREVEAAWEELELDFFTIMFALKSCGASLFMVNNFFGF